MKGAAMITVGTKVKVFGKRLATVVAVSANGNRFLVTGEYDGWTNAKNVAAV